MAKVLKAAILDDYQKVALSLAEWSRLAGQVEFTAFSDHLTDLDALAERLAPFEIVLMNRERTPFFKPLLDRLPNLKLLLTSGMVNRSIDVAAANARGITVCGSRSASSSTARPVSAGASGAFGVTMAAQDYATASGLTNEMAAHAKVV